MDKRDDYVLIFKALADETRLRIVEMLSCGEMCACDILEFFKITQPTLSYHLKILTECGIVKGRKDGSLIWYNNNAEAISSVKNYWTDITEENEACICHEAKGVGRCESLSLEQ